MHIAAELPRDDLVSGVDRMLRAVETTSQGQVTDADVATAKEALVGSYRAQIATVEGAATSYGRPDEPLDHVRSYPTRIGRVTRADVVRAAARYLRAEALHVLLFTDARSFDAAPLGLGPPVVLAASP